jgi:hypothetical protein
MDVGLVICNLFNDALTQGCDTKAMAIGLWGPKPTVTMLAKTSSKLPTHKTRTLSNSDSMPSNGWIITNNELKRM